MDICNTRTICAVLIAGLICCAGCISSQAPDPSVTTMPQAVPTAAPAAGTPSATASATPILEPTTAGTPATTVPPATPLPVPTPTWIPKSYGRDATDDPQIVLFVFVKGCMVFDIPDCGMRTAFPQAAVDPSYGIQQPVPKLMLLTEDEINAFIEKYQDETNYYPDNERHIDPNTIGGPQCAGVIANPTWNFVRINATLMPRNARPGEYDIGINVRSRGNIIEQLRMNQTFILDQPVILIRYIPMRVDEMDAFDSTDMVFARRG